MTEYGRALYELNIELICGHRSQAKGRVERANKTVQSKRYDLLVSIQWKKQTSGCRYLLKISIIALLVHLIERKILNAHSGKNIMCWMIFCSPKDT